MPLEVMMMVSTYNMNKYMKFSALEAFFLSCLFLFYIRSSVKLAMPDTSDADDAVVVSFVIIIDAHHFSYLSIEVCRSFKSMSDPLIIFLFFGSISKFFSDHRR